MSKNQQLRWKKEIYTRCESDDLSWWEISMLRSMDKEAGEGDRQSTGPGMFWYLLIHCISGSKENEGTGNTFVSFHYIPFLKYTY